jgi:hypothetical protein
LINHLSSYRLFDVAPWLCVPLTELFPLLLLLLLVLLLLLLLLLQILVRVYG